MPIDCIIKNSFLNELTMRKLFYIIIVGDNMKSKGFTLVELLGVIVLLGLIALIAVPAITGIIKQGKDSLSNSQKESILMSAKNWAADKNNLGKLPESGNCIYFYLSLLQNSGYADLEIKDPKTNKAINPIIKISKEGKQLNFEIDPTATAICTPITS